METELWTAGALALVVLAQCGCGSAGSMNGNPPAESKAGAAALFEAPAAQLAHLRVVTVAEKSWPATVQTTGTVDWDADHTTQVITQVNGPISRLLVDYGAEVKAGDPLLYVSSPDVVNAISAYRKARNREALAKRVLDRMHVMLEHGAVAVKDMEGSEADYNDARTDVQNSLQALRIFGITRQDIEQAEQQGAAIRTELAVRAPIAGVVVQKLVTPGMLVQAGATVCFVLSDVSTVWVQGHIFDRDLPLVRTGDAVDESNPASTRTFHGVVNYVGALVDPATRTTPVRIVTRNPGGVLKKDMFVEAAIHSTAQARWPAVPLASVLRDDKNEPMVFVEAQPGKFAQRPVTLGPQHGGEVAITSGLQAGEHVLADGSLFVQFATSIQ